MKLVHLTTFTATVLLMGALLVDVEGLAPNSQPKTSPRAVSSSLAAAGGGAAAGFSRRNFVATSIVGTVLAGSSLETLAAAPANGLALVTPNSLQGKTVVITGATTGIGLESAKAMAKGGATTVLTARTDKKGMKAVETVQAYLQQEGISNDEVLYVQLDLDDLENVKTFPKRFQERLGGGDDSSVVKKIDIVMNNAGVMAIPDRQLTKDGYERTFQSNHLGHFALVAKLFPYLNENAKVINVSSSAYQIAAKGLDIDNLNGEKEYSPWSSYGQSKLENILFSQELQRRADAAGIPLTVNSLHPGVINTDLARNMMGGDEVWFEKREKGPTSVFEKMMDATLNKALLTPPEGAATQVYLAITNTAEKGRFYSDLKAQKLPPFATDAKAAKALWERSEELAGVQFNVAK